MTDVSNFSLIHDSYWCFCRVKEKEVLPLTLSAAVLDTVPYLLLAVQVNIPESSGKTSAMTSVHISSRHKKVILTLSSWFGLTASSNRDNLNTVSKDTWLVCFKCPAVSFLWVTGAESPSETEAGWKDLPWWFDTGWETTLYGPESGKSSPGLCSEEEQKP